MEKQFDIVAVGEILVDFVSRETADGKKLVLEGNPGGAPANVLAAASRLGKRTGLIGKVGSDEVDFVAQRQSTLTYFQVTADMTAQETFEREMKPLRAIRDNYPKVVLTLDRSTPGDYEGIQVTDWLLGK